MEWNDHRTGPHSDELPRRCTGWFATINPYNLSQCAAPSVDPSERLDVPGEYWRPRRKPRGQELQTRTHADPNRVSRIAAQSRGAPRRCPEEYQSVTRSPLAEM